MIFKDDKHKEAFTRFMNRMQSADCYHKSAAYLLALDAVRDHVNSIFDFSDDVIKPECLQAAWQTGTSAKVCRLLFNLWNGYAFDGETDEPSSDYSPESLFCNSDMPYMLEAVRLRFSIYDNRKDGASDD